MLPAAETHVHAPALFRFYYQLDTVDRIYHDHRSYGNRHAVHPRAGAPFLAAYLDLTDSFHVVNLADYNSLSADKTFHIGPDAVPVELLDSQRAGKDKRHNGYYQE